MAEKKALSNTKDFEKALKAANASHPTYVLRLYVAGMTPKSTRTVADVKKICDEYLAGRYELEVIDIAQKPHLAKDAQIIAAPTLIKKLPLPLRRIIGDMSKTERVLVGLDLRKKEPGP